MTKLILISFIWSLFQKPDGFWRAPLQRNTFNISLGIVRSLPWGPCGLAGKRLPRMQEVVGSNPTEGTKIYISNFTLLEWNVKNCFL